MECEHCHTSNDCKTLNLVMRLLEDHSQITELTDLSRAYKAYKTYLTEQAWSYPLGDSPCTLVGRNSELRVLVDELISLWREAQSKGRLAHYEEEVQYD